MSTAAIALESVTPSGTTGGAASSDGGVRPARPARGLPDLPRRIRVGMPQLDAGGLSENWLFRHAGDLQWEAIARRLGVASDEIRGAGGPRLYPTVVAVRARYGAPLAAVQENDVLDTSIELSPAGRACAWGRVGVTSRDRRLSLELLTTFAVRDRAAGALRMMPPAPALARRWVPPEGSPPPIARLARAARRGEPLDDAFAGPVLARAAAALAAGRAPLGAIAYEPSPYADFNGAGLLYFASYVTIADSAERQLVRRLCLDATTKGVDGADWALATSAVRRDVYYYENLPLGGCLTAYLLEFEVEPDAVTTHVRLTRAQAGHDAGQEAGPHHGRTMADVITRRCLTGRRS